MNKKHSKYPHVYAVVRVDVPINYDYLENSITITKVFSNMLDAEQEASRLNELNENKGSRYIVKTGRLIQYPGSKRIQLNTRIVNNEFRRLVTLKEALKNEFKIEKGIPVLKSNQLLDRANTETKPSSAGIWNSITSMFWKEWGHNGYHNFPDGPRLIGQLSNIGKDDLIHKLYEPLALDYFHVLTGELQNLQIPLHNSYADFLQGCCNGADLFRSSIVLFGFRYSFEGINDFQSQPIDLIAMNYKINRPKSMPQDTLIVGWYSGD